MREGILLSEEETSAEQKKEKLIMMLIDCGIYKVKGRQLHELTLSEIEEQIKVAINRKLQ